jgi:hypothetical protein
MSFVDPKKAHMQPVHVNTSEMSEQEVRALAGYNVDTFYCRYLVAFGERELEVAAHWYDLYLEAKKKRDGST